MFPSESLAPNSRVAEVAIGTVIPAYHQQEIIKISVPRKQLSEERALCDLPVQFSRFLTIPANTAIVL